MIRVLLVLLAWGPILSAEAGARRLVASSDNERVRLLELYTSESCSSCPPAESWISTLKSSPELWKRVVPVAFHVDYWNDLGWVDGLSANSMTRRQRDLAQTWPKPTVYTPAFAVDGKEWREWGSALPAEAGTTTLQLEVYQEADGSFSVTVKGIEAAKGNYVVRLARLGMGLTQKITGGENRGRELSHDFAVLSWDAQKVSARNTTVSLRLGNGRGVGGREAIAAWIEAPGSPVPLQAAGGYL